MLGHRKGEKVGLGKVVFFSLLLNVAFDIKWTSVQEPIVGNDMVVFSTGLPVCSVQGCLMWLRWKILDEFAQALAQYISDELLILWTRIILTDVTTLKTARVWHVPLPLIALFMLSFRLWSGPLQQDVGWDLLLSTKTAEGGKNTFFVPYYLCLPHLRHSLQ